MSHKAASSLSERKGFPVPLGDLGSINSAIHEQRVPRPDSTRRRKRNPFSERRRNNFPDINDVFKSTTASSSGLIHGDNGFHDHRTNIFDEDDEEGYCQQSDIDGSSVLNMSIGARAALNEHARHVAKFGIDGEKIVEAEVNNNSNSSDEINSDICTNVLLDDQWERILDLSRVASSLGGSVSEGIPSPPHSTTIDLHFDNSSSEKRRFEESSSSEVMTDVSHDFFNSSRVNLLITPERNKNRRTEMVITRDRVGVDDIPLDSQLRSSFGGETEIFCYHDENDTGDSFIESSSRQQRRRNDTGLQGSSFNLGDISRISTNTVSDTNCTPDASFHNYHKKDTWIAVDDSKTNDEGFEITTIFGTGPQSIILNDSSFLSVSTPASLRSPPGCHVQQEPVSASRNESTSTESASPGENVHSSSSIQSVVSTFVTEACTFAKQLVSDVEKSIEGMESLSADFLRGVEIDQTDAPSPISQVLSSPSASRQGEVIREQRRFEKSMNVDINCSSNIDTNTHYKSTSSFASSTVEDAIQIHLTGRKRYRTVVPRRVYLDSPTQQFNEEQDSFGAVQSNPETTRAGTSLLESFKEAATNKTF